MKTKITIKDIRPKMTIAEAVPMLKLIARFNNLKLNRTPDFQKVTTILKSRLN
jgi:hypothetical protein